MRLGDPLAEATTLGPLNNEAVAAKMDSHLADAADRALEVLVGGERAAGFPTDLYYPLTVVDGVGTRRACCSPTRVLRSGPAHHHLRRRRGGHGRLANDTDLGLQMAVFTSSLTRAFRYIDGLRAGSIVVNDSTGLLGAPPAVRRRLAAPRTGWGRIGGKYTLLDMTDLRTAVIDVAKTRDA